MTEKAKNEAVELAKKGRVRHGIISWIDNKRVPSGRAFTQVRKDLQRLRDELIERHGGPDKITPEAAMLVESLIEAQGVIKLATLYIRKAGVLRQDSLKHGALELHPILGKSLIAYTNTIRQNCLALETLRQAKGKGEDDGIIPLTRYIEIRDAEIAAERAVKASLPAGDGPDAPQDAPGGRTDGGQGEEP
ncbi:MAG: hypothetical protein ABFD52_07845 [Acidobacteriota bacterium]